MTEQVQDRINLVYKDKKDGSEKELPFKILVMSDLNPGKSVDLYEDIETVQLRDSSLSSVFQEIKPELTIKVANHLNGRSDDLVINLKFQMIDDFNPELVSYSIPGFNKLMELREKLCRLVEHPSTMDQQEAENILGSLQIDGRDVDKIAAVIARVDEKLANQLNEVLHCPEFCALESAWRSLDYLANEIEFHENCMLDILAVSKSDLQDSFEDSPKLTQSPLYQLVYSSEFGQFGGQPYSLLVGDYQFTAGVQDIALLTAISQVAAISHAPFVSAAGAEFFNMNSYEEFSRMRDLKSHFEQPGFDKWNSFRATEDARYIALCMPRFLLRKAYRESLGLGFEFKESYGSAKEKGLWGNGAIALAAKISQSFASFRWFVNIVGEEYGVMEKLELSTGRGAQKSQIPTEVLISDRVEGDIVENGFVPITLRKGKQQAGFYSAVCVKKASEDITEIQAQLDTQLSFILIACRFAHYLKVIQRENIGAWVSRAQIDLELNKWLKQYISDMDNPAPGVRARRPLRNAKITVRDVDGSAGWYSIMINLTPHFKYLGQPVNLQEVGRLERS